MYRTVHTAEARNGTTPAVASSHGDLRVAPLRQALRHAGSLIGTKGDGVAGEQVRARNVRREVAGPVYEAMVALEENPDNHAKKILRLAQHCPDSHDLTDDLCRFRSTTPAPMTSLSAGRQRWTPSS